MSEQDTRPGERARYGATAQQGQRGKLPMPFPRQMGANCMAYLEEVVESGLTVDMTGRFERAFADRLGLKHCVATPGCTPALAILAAAFDFEPGDEVIVSPITDYGTIMGLCLEGLIPVFADTDEGSPNLSAATIAPLIGERTRAILCVHKTGLICDMDPINELAERHGLVVYEDACQAVMGRYKGRLAGTLARAAGFSFDPEKTLGSDTGGCVVTDDDELAERLRFVGHSRGARMQPGFGRVHDERGYAYRMPQCTAAITLAQLEDIEAQVEHIDGMVRYLTRLLGEIPGIVPLAIPDYVTTYSAWMTGFSIAPAAFRVDAEEFARQVAEEGIPGAGLGRYYLMPEACLFLQRQAREREYPYSRPPASRDYVYGGETCPNARAFLANFVRWSSICAKYRPEDCETAAAIVRTVADRNRA